MTQQHDAPAGGAKHAACVYRRGCQVGAECRNERRCLGPETAERLLRQREETLAPTQPVAYMVDCGNTDIAQGDVRFWRAKRKDEAHGCALAHDTVAVPLYLAPLPSAPSGLVDAGVVRAYLAEADAYDKLGCAGKLNVVAINAANRKNAARLALDAALDEQRSPDPLAPIAQWCEETFGPISVERIVSRAAEEMDELRAEPHKADEVADVIINLSRYPGAWVAVQAKMAVNRGRRWRLMGDGTGYHIKLDGSTSAPKAMVTQTVALIDVVAERRRQVEAEGWTPQHDDQHQDGEMAEAAACYAISSTLPRNSTLFPPGRWAWRLSDWKPAGPRRDLIKAGALILAEIERLDRLNSTTERSNG